LRVFQFLLSINGVMIRILNWTNVEFKEIVMNKKAAPAASY